MDQRELQILEAVLSYALSNLDDLNQAFEPVGKGAGENMLWVQGRYIKNIEEAELKALLFKQMTKDAETFVLKNRK